MLCRRNNENAIYYRNTASSRPITANSNNTINNINNHNHNHNYNRNHNRNAETTDDYLTLFKV